MASGRRFPHRSWMLPKVAEISIRMGNAHRPVREFGLHMTPGFAMPLRALIMELKPRLMTVAHSR
jgi:hypothetical protein